MQEYDLIVIGGRADIFARNAREKPDCERR